MTQLLKVAEAAQRLQVTRRTYYRMVQRGELPPPIRRNRNWVRVPAADIDQYLAKLIELRPAGPPLRPG